MYTVKGFSIVNEAEVDCFVESSCFFDDPMDIGYPSRVCSVFALVGVVGHAADPYLYCCDSYLQRLVQGVPPPLELPKSLPEGKVRVKEGNAKD